MAFTKIVSPGIDTTGSYTVQELNTVGVMTAGTVQVGAATTVHTTGIDLGSGNITSHNINSTGIITATSFVGPVTGNITGDITATSGTFSGNVSIGGTLTYEDVTNVDSVGIVTAQAGIHVTGGSVGIGTDNPDTQLQVFGSSTTGNLKIGGGNGAGNHRVFISCTETNSYIDSYGNNAYGKLRINAAPLLLNDAGGGSVGIGTDNPDATLKVNVASGNNGVVVQNTSTANIALIGARNGDATLQVGQFGSTASGTTFGLSNANLAFIYTTTYNTTHPSALALGTVSNKPIVFATNNTEKLRITSDGSFGIGTASPDEKLECVGNIAGFNLVGNSLTNADFGNLVGGPEDGYKRLTATSGGFNSKLSIGDKVTVLGQERFITSITSDTIAIVDTAWSQTFSSGTSVTIEKGIGFVTASTERLRITSDGNVKVGNFSTVDTRNTGGLHIRDSKGISFRSNTSQSVSRNWRIRNDDYGWGNLDFSVGDTVSDWGDSAADVLLSLTSNRRVGINATVPEQRLDVVGLGYTSAVFRPDASSSSAYGDASAVNNLIQLRMPYGVNAGSVSNNGARWGIQFTGRNDGSGYGSDVEKSASIYAISEDTLGYNREVGLAFYTSPFDANQEERLRITSDGDTELRNRVVGVNNAYSQYLKFRTTQTNNQSAVTGAIAAQGKSGWGGDLVFFSKDANSTPNDTVTERMRILSGGQVNIGGNYTQTTYQLQVDGGITGDYFVGRGLSDRTGYKYGASGMYTLTLGGSRGSNGSSFTMFEVHGMYSSKFFEIMINFGHAGGGIHGSYRRFAGFSNGYTTIQTLENVTANYGGGGGFTISKPDNNTVRVAWNGASSYADAYTLSCQFKTSNPSAYFKNVDSAFG